ncbi:hypothetical protein BH11BAC4_BH11BAC4_01170 [soil metagenome]
MNLINLNFFKRVYQKITGISYNLSYSQTGEDLIIEFMIAAKKIKNFTYLDIGANHPVRLNNSFKFYENGYKGVCIEPDPSVFKILCKKRPKDICLNIGIAGKASGEAYFYIMNNPVLNTFSKEEATSLEKNNHGKIKKVIKVPLKTIEEIIDDYFNGISPVFINLDVEGLDEEILRNFPFDKYRPTIFCIETVHFTDDASSEKRSEIFNIMSEYGYKTFADTYINTIFINTLI